MTEQRFIQRPPWWGGHLQTVRNLLLNDMADLSPWRAERLTFDALDGSGDRLAGTLNRSKIESRGDLVILIHGLTGCESSAYMLAAAAHLLGRGHNVLRLNLRGAGPSRSLSCQYYHAGRTDDLRAVLAQLPADLETSPIAIAGFSLGGNVLLKYLAEEGPTARPFAGMSVSAPIDLSIAAHCFHRARNWPYRHWLVSRMRTEILGGNGLTPNERDRVSKVRSIVELDEHFTAPRNGYADAEDYYRQCSTAHRLQEIEKPTIIVHANDDPWIPRDPYERIQWSGNNCLVPILIDRGGHVGFHGIGAEAPWYATIFGDFVERFAGRSVAPACQPIALAASTAK